MFHLTRRERMLMAGILLAFLVGLAVKHHREQEKASHQPEFGITNAKR